MIVGPWVGTDRRAWWNWGKSHSIRSTTTPHTGAIGLDLTLLRPQTTPLTTDSSGAQSLLVTRIGVRAYAKQRRGGAG